jgi:toxin-antitoxin system PIN domain toxin
MLLPDVNVWLALTFDSHEHHPPAKAWFAALSDELCLFCRSTQQGFLRLSTSRKVFGNHALTLVEAWRKYDLFQTDARISFANEPENTEAHWRALTQRSAYSPNVWNDAYLAALAKAAGLQLVTFDRGFSQYKGVRCTILS